MHEVAALTLAEVDDSRFPEPSPPRLVGPRVTLRAATPSDYDFLYELAVDAETGFRWRFRGGTPSPDEFRQFLWNQVSAQFLITETSTGRPLGVSTTYGTSHRDGWSYLALCGHPSTNGSGLAMEGVLLTIEYAFTIWDIHKIYFEVPEYNLAAMARDLDAYAVREGVLTDHLYFRERRWNMSVYAISRLRWRELKDSNILVRRALCLERQDRDEAAESLFLDLDAFIDWVRTTLEISVAVTPDTHLSELNIDSLSMLELEAGLVEHAHNPVIGSAVGWDTTIREAYLLLCEASSMPTAR